MAGALAILAVAEVATGQVSGPRAAAVPLALLMTLPLAARRRYPLAVTVAVSASFLLNWVAGVDMYSYWASIVVALVTAYTAAAHLRPRLAAVALACLYAAVVVAALGLSGLLWGGVLIGGAALAGFALRDRRRHSASWPDWPISWSWPGTRTPAPLLRANGPGSRASCTTWSPIRSA